MNEVRQFLRYVTPGLAFVIETVLVLWCFNPSWTEQHVFMAMDMGFGNAATLFVASGGVGYFLSVVHHQWHWCRSSSPIDFRPLVQRLRDANLVDLQPPRALTREEAWIVVTALWSEDRGDENFRLSASAHDRNSSMNDLFHSVGAARAGAVLAPFVAGIIASRVSGFSHAIWDIVRFSLGLVAAFGVAFVFHETCKRTGRMTQQFIAEIMVDALSKSRSVPVITHVENG